MRAADTAYAPSPMIGLLRLLLLLEAVAGLGLTIFLSLVADAVGGSSEVTIRFAAGGAIVFAILAAVASRGARKRRPWGWTLAAFLQLVLAIGTGVVVMTTEWHPAYLVGFALAALVMLVLSTATVRSALGQDLTPPAHS